MEDTITKFLEVLDYRVIEDDLRRVYGKTNKYPFDRISHVLEILFLISTHIFFTVVRPVHSSLSLGCTVRNEEKVCLTSF